MSANSMANPPPPRLSCADGIGYLADAATTPVFRRRGLQSALLRRRIGDASAARADTIFTGTSPFPTSRRNMERAGMRVHFMRALRTPLQSSALELSALWASRSTRRASRAPRGMARARWAAIPSSPPTASAGFDFLRTLSSSAHPRTRLCWSGDRLEWLMARRYRGRLATEITAGRAASPYSTRWSRRIETRQRSPAAAHSASLRCWRKKAITSVSSRLWNATRSKPVASVQSSGRCAARAGAQGARKAKCAACGTT